MNIVDEQSELDEFFSQDKHSYEPLDDILDGSVDEPLDEPFAELD